MSDFTEAQERAVAAIAKDVFERQVTDPKSMFRLVLQNELFNFGQQMLTDINTKIDKVVAPLANNTNIVLQGKQDDEAEERLKQQFWFRVQVAGGIIGILVGVTILIGAAYGLVAFIRHY